MKNKKLLIFIAVGLLVIIIGLLNKKMSYPENQNPPPNTALNSKSEKTATLSDQTTTTKTILWGAYVGDRVSDLAAFEQLVGKSVDMRSFFSNWGESFPTAWAADLKASNKTLVLFWEQYGTTLDRIISGEYDFYIKQFATDAKNYGGEVILAPLHEMNDGDNPWSGAAGNNTPAKVIAAWKRIYGFFSEANNVKFAWDVNNISAPDTAQNAIAVYYPGDDYVDYVAIDGFNFNDPWQTFDQVFGGALNQLKTYKKPVYILSFACAPDGRKANWIGDALTIQIPKHPEIKGWLWFNVNKEEDWRVNSDSASLSAFKAALP